MKFTKMHGCGNDYIFVNCLIERVRDPEKMAKWVSNRHFGIGGDGLVLIGESSVADFSMRMYNADGSIGEMCGNAIRCIGKYLFEGRWTNKTTLTIETLAGIKTLFLTVYQEKVIEVMVDMGHPQFEIEVERESLPIQESVQREKIRILDKEFLLTCVNMGNPHAVIFVNNVKQMDIHKYGLPLEYNLRFPNRTNVEFVQLVDPSNIIMRTWERGTGETMACGTGACAAVMAGIKEKGLTNTVIVHAKGGKLKVEYNEKDNLCFLSGPAEKVFDGEIDPIVMREK